MNWLSLLRACYGGALLAAPDRLAGQLAGGRLTTATRRSMRILAARQLVEAAVCAVRPTRSVLRLEADVDVVHAATMAVMAVATRHRSSRRAAALNVATATAFVGADIAVMAATSAQNSAVPSRSNGLLFLRDTLARRICQVLPYPAGTH
jgi:hypothetical protein